MKQPEAEPLLGLIWTDQAVRELDAIADFIAMDDAVAAMQWAEQLVEAAEKIPNSPRMGRKVPELAREDLRELIRGNYRIVYRISEKYIEILTVFEGHRLLRPSPR